MFIKFTMSTKEHFVLPFEQARKIIESIHQVVMIHGPDGEWSGQTLNKAFLISTKRDIEAEKEWHSQQTPPPPLPEPELTPEQKEAVDKQKGKISEMMKTF